MGEGSPLAPKATLIHPPPGRGEGGCRLAKAPLGVDLPESLTSANPIQVDYFIRSDKVCQGCKQPLPGFFYQCPVIKMSPFNFQAFSEQSFPNKEPNRKAIFPQPENGIRRRSTMLQGPGVDR